jgi:hypothetical protein
MPSSPSNTVTRCAEAFQAARNAGDLERAAAMLTSDAVVVGWGEWNVVTGSEGIRAWLRLRRAERVTVETTGLFVDGNVVTYGFRAFDEASLTLNFPPVAGTGRVELRTGKIAFLSEVGDPASRQQRGAAVRTVSDARATQVALDGAQATHVAEAANSPKAPSTQERITHSPIASIIGAAAIVSAVVFTLMQRRADPPSRRGAPGR